MLEPGPALRALPECNQDVVVSGCTDVAEVVLATDLHAGNVLQAERQPWLVIDPKPFVGDPAFDATPLWLRRVGLGSMRMQNPNQNANRNPRRSNDGQ